MNAKPSTTPREVPMLFSAPMVRAILQGRKTQTRRALNPQPSDSWMKNVFLHCPDGVMFDRNGNRRFWISGGSERDEIKPPCQPGNVIYVRETFRRYHEMSEVSGMSQDQTIEYRADGEGELLALSDGDGWGVYNKDGSEKYVPWIPSLHMKKEHARIWLEVESVRVERLQDISQQDAVQEGIQLIDGKLDDAPTFRNYNFPAGHHCDMGFGFPANSFGTLWRSINGEESWDANPWVWVISFRVLSTTGKP